MKKIQNKMKLIYLLEVANNFSGIHQVGSLSKKRVYSSRYHYSFNFSMLTYRAGIHFITRLLCNRQRLPSESRLYLKMALDMHYQPDKVKQKLIAKNKAEVEPLVK